jgi:hypothetical protein
MTVKNCIAIWVKLKMEARLDSCTIDSFVQRKRYDALQDKFCTQSGLQLEQRGLKSRFVVRCSDGNAYLD